MWFITKIHVGLFLEQRVLLSQLEERTYIIEE